MSSSRSRTENSAEEGDRTAQADSGEVVHDLRNALAGVRGAVQVVRDSMAEGMEREILGEVIQRLDDMDQLLVRFASADGTADR